MSARVTGEVFKRYDGGGGELLLALALADHSHDDGTNIYPGIALLAAKTRQSERTVQYQIQKMVKSGWLIQVAEAQFHLGRGRGINRGREYRISPEWLAGKPMILPAASPEQLGLKVVSDDGRGANIAPLPEPQKGCNPAQEGVQKTPGRGATAIAPKPKDNHKSKQERDAHARDAPAHGVRTGRQSDPMFIHLPMDWQPDEDCKAVLRARSVAMPEKHVIDGFVSHWMGKWIEPRLIPAEFLKWVSREPTMQLGRRGGVAAGADAEQSAIASAAWDEVRQANRSGIYPAQWKDPRTESAIKAIGGRSLLRDMLTRDVPFKRQAFIAAFLSLAVAA